MKKKYLVEKVSYFVVYATIIFATVFITEAVHGAELVEAKVFLRNQSIVKLLIEDQTEFVMMFWFQ